MPVALLEADDTRALRGQAPGERGAGGTGADDHDVRRLVRHQSVSR